MKKRNRKKIIYNLNWLKNEKKDFIYTRKNNKHIMKKLENLLDFEDFKSNWEEKKQKKTKRTEVGLDIIEEKKTENSEEVKPE
jgi:hypothetical protein